MALPAPSHKGTSPITQIEINDRLSLSYAKVKMQKKKKELGTPKASITFNFMKMR